MGQHGLFFVALYFSMNGRRYYVPLHPYRRMTKQVKQEIIEEARARQDELFEPMTADEDKYYRYLVRLVDRGKDYRKSGMIFDALWRKEFYSIVNNDFNREADGLQLRTEPFVSWVLDGIDIRRFIKRDKHCFGPCRVLEMLIALSKRCEFATYDPDGCPTYKDWFWELISNLNLDIYRIVGDDELIEIKEKLDVLLERRYLKNGKGGLFPLKDPDYDQRKIEIWYQMQAYVMEKKNYPKHRIAAK